MSGSFNAIWLDQSQWGFYIFIVTFCKKNLKISNLDCAVTVALSTATAVQVEVLVHTVVVVNIVVVVVHDSAVVVVECGQSLGRKSRNLLINKTIL